jgi:hypothetical protein
VGNRGSKASAEAASERIYASIATVFAGRFVSELRDTSTHVEGVAVLGSGDSFSPANTTPSP